MCEASSRTTLRKSNCVGKDVGTGSWMLKAGNFSRQKLSKVPGKSRVTRSLHQQMFLDPAVVEATHEIIPKHRYLSLSMP